MIGGFRIGQGFDVHRFAAGRRLVLCGVEVSGGPGLDGHSDADVALHALTDALLGAMAAGDLGEHFAADDQQWRDADSEIFLRRALEVVADGGFGIANCDLTIIGELPRISPHRTAMRRRLAALLGVGVDRVSIKATTSDGLGFTGRGEGLAAMAVVLLEGVDHE